MIGAHNTFVEARYVGHEKTQTFANSFRNDMLEKEQDRHHLGERTLSQSLWTSTSASCLQVIKLSIQPSSVGMVAGSAWTGDRSAGALPTSSMLVSMALIDCEVVRWIEERGGPRKMTFGTRNGQVRSRAVGQDERS